MMLLRNVFILMMLLAGAGFAAVATPVATITLRERAVMEPGPVRLVDVAELTGDAATDLAETPIGTLSARGNLTVDRSTLRTTLDKFGAHWGRLTLRGAGSVSVTAKPDQVPADLQPAVVEANPVEVLIVGGDQGAGDEPLDAQSSVLRHLMRWMMGRLGGDPGDVRVVFSDADRAVIEEPMGADRFEFMPLTRDTLGRVPIAVLRHRARGVDRVIVRPTVQRRSAVVITLRPIGRGQRIADEDLRTEVIWLENDAPSLLNDAGQAVGQMARGSLITGQRLDVNDLKQDELVRRGQRVQVVMTRDAVTLRLDGRAMESGEQGAWITVRNDSTRETFHARVIGPGRVEAGVVPVVQEGSR